MDESPPHVKCSRRLEAAFAKRHAATPDLIRRGDWGAIFEEFTWQAKATYKLHAMSEKSLAGFGRVDRHLSKARKARARKAVFDLMHPAIDKFTWAGDQGHHVLAAAIGLLWALTLRECRDFAPREMRQYMLQFACDAAKPLVQIGESDLAKRLLDDCCRAAFGRGGLRGPKRHYWKFRLDCSQALVLLRSGWHDEAKQLIQGCLDFFFSVWQLTSEQPATEESEWRTSLEKSVLECLIIRYEVQSRKQQRLSFARASDRRRAEEVSDAALSLLTDFAMRAQSLPKIQLAQMLLLQAEEEVAKGQVSWEDVRSSLIVAWSLLEPETGRTKWVLAVRIRILLATIEPPVDRQEVEAIIEEIRELDDGTTAHKRLLHYALRFIPGYGEGLSPALDEIIALEQDLVEQYGDLRPALQRNLINKAYFLARDGRFDEAAHIIGEASICYFPWKHFLDPIESMAGSQNIALADLLVLILCRTTISAPPDATLVLSDRFRCPVLGNLMNDGLEMCVSPDSLRAQFSLTVRELVAQSAAVRMLPENMERERRYLETLRRVGGLQEELLERGEKLAGLGVGLEKIDAFVKNSGRIVIDIRVTPLGAVIHCHDGKSVQRSVLQDVTSDWLDCLLTETEEGKELGWLHKREDASGRHVTEDGFSKATTDWELATDRLVEEVSNRLTSRIEPMLNELPEGAPVCFILGGTLSYVPLHACHWKSGNPGSRWLDRFSISYSPSITVLMLARGASFMEFPEPRAAIQVVANPPFDGDLRKLPFTGFEAAALDYFYRPTEVFCGDKATVQKFDSVPVDRLHIGTHTVHDPTSPMFTTLSLADQPVASWGLFCGHPAFVRHAILSCCDAGTGDTAASEGDSLNPTTAFLARGASRVWATMWHVDDRSTAMLMLLAHRQLIEGKTACEALRVAQRTLRDMRGEEAYRLARPAFDHLAQDPERFGCSQKDLSDVEKGLIELRFMDLPFRHPCHWGAVQHVGF